MFDITQEHSFWPNPLTCLPLFWISPQDDLWPWPSSWPKVTIYRKCQYYPKWFRYISLTLFWICTQGGLWPWLSSWPKVPLYQKSQNFARCLTYNITVPNSNNCSNPGSALSGGHLLSRNLLLEHHCCAAFRFLPVYPCSGYTLKMTFDPGHQFHLRFPYTKYLKATSSGSGIKVLILDLPSLGVSSGQHRPTDILMDKTYP